MGCMFLMRTHRLGLVFFAVAIVAIYGSYLQVKKAPPNTWDKMKGGASENTFN